MIMSVTDGREPIDQARQLVKEVRFICGIEQRDLFLPIIPPSRRSICLTQALGDFLNRPVTFGLFQNYCCERAWFTVGQDVNGVFVECIVDVCPVLWEVGVDVLVVRSTELWMMYQDQDWTYARYAGHHLDRSVTRLVEMFAAQQRRSQTQWQEVTPTF